MGFGSVGTGFGSGFGAETSIGLWNAGFGLGAYPHGTVGCGFEATYKRQVMQACPCFQVADNIPSLRLIHCSSD